MGSFFIPASIIIIIILVWGKNLMGSVITDCCKIGKLCPAVQWLPVCLWKSCLEVEQGEREERTGILVDLVLHSSIC